MADLKKITYQSGNIASNLVEVYVREFGDKIAIRIFHVARGSTRSSRTIPCADLREVAEKLMEVEEDFLRKNWHKISED